jgi:recombination protein RecA
MAGVLQKLEKQYGQGSVMRLGDETRGSVPVISTGSISVDFALGTGGLPRGRVVEIYGPESSGKTTLALQAIAQAQAEGGGAAFIDAEHALDPTYARRLGVDVVNLVVSQPDHGEQALEIAASLIGGNCFDIVVVDSVAALVPKAEIEGEMGDSFMGVHARLMSQALRKLTGVVSRTGTCLVFINQIREKIGVMFGNPETTTGGRALKFFSSVRIEVRRTTAIKDGDKAIGARTKVKIVKNKLAAPFQEVEVEVIFGQGIVPEADLLDLAASRGIVDKSGSWYTFGGERLGQGREAAKAHLSANPAKRAHLENTLRKALHLPALQRNAGTAAAAAVVPPAAKGPGSERPQAPQTRTLSA